LPRSFGQGSLIRSQLDPHSLRQLIDSFPTVVNGLKSGKVSPVKALIHHKLPDQSQVRRIFNEVHSHGERIELNMYIVGESGGEEEAEA
jgi:succinate dehydrogenase / fumarate reductase iron-sulfur subunit